MHPAESQPDGSTRATNTEGSPPVGHDEGLLEQVLSETLRATGREAAGEVRVLRQVGAKHAGQTLSLYPITFELVHSLLSYRFRRLTSPERLRRMSEVIAETLWNDPRTHHRLVVFWCKLSEVPAES